MTSTALTEIREQQATSLAAGDNAAANRAYAMELQALRGNAVVPAGSSEGAVEAVYTALDDAKYPMEQVDELRRTWAGSETESLALARAYVDDHPGMVGIVEKFGIGEPGALALAAEAARASGYSFTPRGAQPAPRAPAGVGAEIEFKREMQRRSAEIEAAQADGDSMLANALYQQQQDWLRSQGRGGRIVDGRRTA